MEEKKTKKTKQKLKKYERDVIFRLRMENGVRGGLKSSCRSN